MDLDLFKIIGQIAGIGGISLGIFLILFREVIRKSIFPSLKKEDAFSLLKIFIILVWSIAIIGIIAWVYVTLKIKELDETNNSISVINQLSTGNQSPVVSSKNTRITYGENKND